MKNTGFTLTEIAVSMTIAGLLAAGAVAGHKMIRNADVASTVMQVRAIETATMKFHDYYKDMPGDMLDGDKRIKNCNQACKNTAPDAGDGKIGSPTWNLSAFQSDSIANAPNTTDAGETTVFWWELANADLGISGITDAGVTGGVATFGGSLPKANLGGGFMVGYSNGLQSGIPQGRPGAASNISITGTVLALAAIPATITSSPGVQALVPLEAAQVDRKMDDGLPNTGNVQAYGVKLSCYGAAAPFSYSETATGKDCGLYFRVGNPPVNGACGGANGVAIGSAPIANLCRAGAPSAVAGGTTNPWSWSCNGSNGGTNAACSAPVNGSCGTANGAGTTTTPSANLCGGGAASAVAGSGPWTWNCNGSPGGTNASCAAPLDGSCGGANGVASATQPAASLCATGTSGGVSGGTSTVWQWSCNGSPGGANASCSAPVNGACGASNGTSSATMPTNLCNAGTASAVSGGGATPWTWSCAGVGGSTASCSAIANPNANLPVTTCQSQPGFGPYCGTSRDQGSNGASYFQAYTDANGQIYSRAYRTGYTGFDTGWVVGGSASVYASNGYCSEGNLTQASANNGVISIDGYCSGSCCNWDGTCGPYGTWLPVCNTTVGSIPMVAPPPPPPTGGGPMY